MRSQNLKKLVWSYYKKYGRHELPWRKTRTPYRILVSEIMLQQTQVDRVTNKYKSFLKQFPTFKSLALAKQSSVLKQWQGLGYNRRALNLKRIAEIVTKKFNGRLPSVYSELVGLPGIGPYTADALRAFIWNEPAVFIETNIRTVFIHHFFLRKKHVHDKDLIPFIEQTLDAKNPREWYYALMDYGAHLKKTIGNPNTRSTHYTKQSPFKGSNRELRGAILRTKLAYPTKRPETMAKEMKRPLAEVRRVLAELHREGFIPRR